VGRVREAREWFVRSAEVDPEGSTDAEERVAEIDGITFEDLEELEDVSEGAVSPEGGAGPSEGPGSRAPDTQGDAGAGRWREDLDGR
jgi:hypothetical protein